MTSQRQKESGATTTRRAMTPLQAANAALNYDDPATVTAKRTPELFKCLMCGRCMRDAGERWECRCGFFYKPLIPGTIPEKYRHAALRSKGFVRTAAR